MTKKRKALAMEQTRVKLLVHRARRIVSKYGETKAGSEALPLIKQAAASGNEEALYAMATWHLFGRFVPKDFRKAAQYLKKAARRHYAPAMFDLAVLYETGRGVTKDKNRAFKQYMCAARQGDVDALKSVGRCLFHGIGTAKNRQVAELILDWTELPASKGNRRRRIG
jgi:TPR repeat protein